MPPAKQTSSEDKIHGRAERTVRAAVCLSLPPPTGLTSTLRRSQERGKQVDACTGNMAEVKEGPGLPRAADKSKDSQREPCRGGNRQIFPSTALPFSQPVSQPVSQPFKLKALPQSFSLKPASPTLQPILSQSFSPSASAPTRQPTLCQSF